MTDINTIDKDHPVAAFKRISAEVAHGNVRLWPGNQEMVQQFLALKLALPSLSDEAAATLLVAAALNTGVQIAGR